MDVATARIPVGRIGGRDGRPARPFAGNIKGRSRTGGTPVPTLEAVVDADRLSRCVRRLPKRLLDLPRWLVCSLIRLYQLTLGPALPAIAGPGCGCRFTPTCSHYALEAVRTHGALAGSWLAARRVARCTPLCRGGFDPVPKI